MPTSRRTLLKNTAAAAAAFSLDWTRAQAQAETVRIGLIYDLTGPFAAGGSVFAMATWSKRDRGRNLAERAAPVDHRFAVASPEHKECWFKPTPRGMFFCFLVQDRLRASDVLHRDWDWSAWL